MIALLQRVKCASVEVDCQKIANIKQGLLIFVGIEKTDNTQNITKLVQKILKYRIFADKHDKMNLSMLDINAQVLLVPQFTLAADTQSGLRPSFSSAASPEVAAQLFTQVISTMATQANLLSSNLVDNWLQTGQFAADMQVSLINDGPVTFLLRV